MKILSKKPHDFDALKLHEQIGNFQPKQIPGYGKDATLIGDFMAKNTDDLVWNQIYDATGRIPGSFTERVVSEAHDHWATNEWASSKTKFMNSLGHRTQKWKNSMAVSNERESSENLGVGQQGQHIDKRERATLYRGRVGDASTIDNSISGGRAIDVNGQIGTVGNSLVPVKQYGLPMSKFAQDHASIVRKISLFGQQQGEKIYDFNSFRPGQEVLNVINDTLVSDIVTETDNLSRKDLECYGDIMKLISEVVGENKRVPMKPGTFSSICPAGCGFNS